jgi:hypothetical protein
VKEILQVAQSMHRNMVEENKKSKAVLREFRQCGWAAYRPQQGVLEDADSQAWAVPFPQSSAKIRASAREDRLTGLDETGKPTVLTDFKSVYEPLTKPDLEVSYCEDVQADAEDACVIEADLGWLTGAQAIAAQANLVHPAKRSKMEKYFLELADLTSQAPAVRNFKSRPIASREEKSKAWRAALGSKSVVDRLASVRPEVGKGQARKTQGPAAQKKTKKWAFKPVLKHGRSQQIHKKEEEPANGQLVGKNVRIVSWDAQPALRNTLVKVARHWPTSKRVEIIEPGGGGQGRQEFTESQVYLITGHNPYN